MFRRRRRSGADGPASADENRSGDDKAAQSSLANVPAASSAGRAAAAQSPGEASSTWTYPTPLPGAAPLTAVELEHELVLIDFDTCRMMEVSPHEYGEVTGGQRRLVGTYGYLAPEVLRGGDYSVQSDLWSVGVILYILMTVRPPLDAETLQPLGSDLGGLGVSCFPSRRKYIHHIDQRRQKYLCAKPHM